MKTKATLLSLLFLSVALLSSSTTFAQDEKESYSMVEITFMLPKIGMEKNFENSVKEHNAKYHKDGPFRASLDYILTGKEAGWYVWIMGPCTFSNLDNRPEDDAHRAHWDKNVSPTVAKYGRTEYWRYNEKISVPGDVVPKYETIWFLDIESGQYNKFTEFMKKVKEANEKRGDIFYRVFNNQFSDNDGRDVAIVWPFKNWAELDDENSEIRETYEEINGPGSWERALDDWRSFTNSVISQHWKIGVN
ncbi:hypothetical protein [uncultured Lutibacter sp.]|uniref:hypothetical protein n=1 Tax=uncultured Lutibacter sp. TaxID=437739 RepID=UPI00260B7E98|nr:hypothetical protein [uncultured Lutibacter sp.]